MKTGKPKDKCAKYELAITDYVLGEEMDMPEDKFFAHLETCDKCLDDLAGWNNIYAALRADAITRKPETQARFKTLLGKLKSGSPQRQTATAKTQDRNCYPRG